MKEGGSSWDSEAATVILNGFSNGEIANGCDYLKGHFSLRVGLIALDL